MLTSKRNEIVYTIQLDTEEVEQLNMSLDLIDLFKREFKKEGFDKEAMRMDKGGFSYRETESNRYYKEYEISIVTRNTIL